MENAFLRFVDRLSAQPDATVLKEALSDVIAALDFQTFAYLLQPEDASAPVQLISNYPMAWTTHYLLHRYDTIDPVIVQAREAQASFTWGSQTVFSATQPEFFEEAARFGIRCGFTIPICDGRPHVAALTLAADTRQLSFERAIERDRTALQLIATLFHRAARRSLVPDRIVDDVVLTPREYECLTWSAKGKTAWEISMILGISHRTAVYHLENAKQKLGVFSLAEAVARLIAATNRF